MCVRTPGIFGISLAITMHYKCTSTLSLPDLRAHGQVGPIIPGRHTSNYSLIVTPTTSLRTVDLLPGYPLMRDHKLCVDYA